MKEDLKIFFIINIREVKNILLYKMIKKISSELYYII